MSSPLHASHYADTAVSCRVAITDNREIGKDTFLVRCDGAAIARRTVPGQFVMVRISGCDDPLIGRPLAVYDISASGSIDLVYHVKGKFTTRLAQCRVGQQLDVWGPLGNGFPVLPCEHLVMVAGGVGQTPFLTLAKEHLGLQRFGMPPRQAPPVPCVTLCFGAQSKDLLAGVADFRAAGVDVRLSTDDGTGGHHGLVTELLEMMLAEPHATADARPGTQVVCCGPVAMMRAVAEITAKYAVPCLVSLETPMACGVGICFTCVARVRDGGQDQWDYKRTCVDGPVFDAAAIVW